MNTERWLSIAGYPAYEVSDLGRVRSRDRLDSVSRSLKGKILKPSAGARGMQVTLSSSRAVRRHCLIRRLVLEAFAPPGSLEKNWEAVNVDGDLTNCALTNLGWRTTQERVAALNARWAI